MNERENFSLDDDEGCWDCNGSGWIIDCCDDTCCGQGYCMHGDGEHLPPSAHTFLAS